ncbi:hypothetical protein [Nocardioides soli]|uniref:WD40 repeat domain-containing protein n=1 Tax=Nocardioides soli TaxID=1036020 RepID=A0A7W4YZM3_9ACTN|nr:hypothetical protein [Nocardioides soli]MBB3040908.1 hypothetical protein [Nocardioides soli]
MSLTSSTTPRRSAGALIAAATVLALTAGPADIAAADSRDRARATSLAAAPGSIVFIRNHNVWLSRPDGSDLHQVTRDGVADKPYQSPSQSDTGVIAVSFGNEIVLMQQNGTVMKRLDPGPLTSGVSKPLDGPPVSVSISPDATKVAYTFAAYQCAHGAPCGDQRATAITHTDSLTAPSVYGQTHYWNPSWVGNGRTIQSGGYLHQITLNDLGQPAQHWFDDIDVPQVPYGEGTDLDDAELSPDGRWLGAVRGYDATTQIVWHRVTGNAQSGPAPAVPNRVCETSKMAGLAGPTWSPDSSTMMWTEPDGLWATTGLDEPCPNPMLVIPNASQPDWSAAAVNPGPLPDKPGKPGKPGTTFSVTKKVAVKGVAKVGKKLRVTGSWKPKASQVRYRWLRGGKPIKRAKAATYRLRKADAGKRISARVTLRAPGVKTYTVTTKRTAKVRR